ncbi:MAG: hypothetical protein GY696_24225 [Gammaproteobacteria bacterium]|nr:hypothetical protein [Gammaproteobacteria bacterium]
MFKEYGQDLKGKEEIRIRRNSLRYSNQPALNKGDIVWYLSSKNVPNKPLKVTKSWTGPWVDDIRVAQVLYRIKPYDMSSLYPAITVHVGRLKKFTLDNTRFVEPPGGFPAMDGEQMNRPPRARQPLRGSRIYGPPIGPRTQPWQEMEDDLLYAGEQSAPLPDQDIWMGSDPGDQDEHMSLGSDQEGPRREVMWSWNARILTHLELGARPGPEDGLNTRGTAKNQEEGLGQDHMTRRKESSLWTASQRQFLRQ